MSGVAGDVPVSAAVEHDPVIRTLLLTILGSWEVLHKFRLGLLI